MHKTSIRIGSVKPWLFFQLIECRRDDVKCNSSEFQTIAAIHLCWTLLCNNILIITIAWHFGSSFRHIPLSCSNVFSHSQLRYPYYCVVKQYNSTIAAIGRNTMVLHWIGPNSSALLLNSNYNFGTKALILRLVLYSCLLECF